MVRKKINTKNFNNPRALAEEMRRILKQELNEAVEIAANAIVLDIRKFIKENWYDVESGSKYYGSGNSMDDAFVVLEEGWGKGNTFFVKVGYDTSIIKPYIPANTNFLNQTGGVSDFMSGENFWPRYASIVDGADMTDRMPAVIEYGWDIENLVNEWMPSSRGIRTSRPGIKVMDIFFSDQEYAYDMLIRVLKARNNIVMR